MIIIIKTRVDLGMWEGMMTETAIGCHGGRNNAYKQTQKGGKKTKWRSHSEL